MKTVGVKMLKNNLSKYLALVKQGTVLLITEHDEVIAEINQPSFSSRKLAKLDALLKTESDQGLLVKATEIANTELLKLLQNNKAKPLAADTLLDDTREDR